MIILMVHNVVQLKMKKIGPNYKYIGRYNTFIN